MYAPSTAVRVAYRLVTLLLVLAAIFAATIVVQAVAAQSFDLPMQVPPDELSGLPAGVEFAGWPDVRMHVADPSAKQVLLHSVFAYGTRLREDVEATI